jgi:hypothetical protein
MRTDEQRAFRFFHGHTCPAIACPSRSTLNWSCRPARANPAGLTSGRCCHCQSAGNGAPSAPAFPLESLDGFWLHQRRAAIRVNSGARFSAYFRIRFRRLPAAVKGRGPHRLKLGLQNHGIQKRAGQERRCTCYCCRLSDLNSSAQSAWRFGRDPRSCQASASAANPTQAHPNQSPCRL